MAESVKEVVPETRPRGQRRGLDRLRASGDGHTNQDSHALSAGAGVRETAAVPQASPAVSKLADVSAGSELDAADGLCPADTTAVATASAVTAASIEPESKAPTDVASREVAAAPRSATRRQGRHLRVLVAVLVLLALLVGWLAYRFEETRSSARADKRQYQQLSATDARNQAVLSAARQAAVTLLTYDYRDLDKDFAAVLNGSTGSFKKDFASKQSTAKTLFTQGKAVASGQVLDAAVASSTPTSATVLAVLDQSVKNVSVPNGTVKHYRMQLKLNKVGSAWLVSDVEFPA